LRHGAIFFCIRTEGHVFSPEVLSLGAFQYGSIATDDQEAMQEILRTP